MVNRFVTETDETVRNDCTVCSFVMTVGYGTNDLIFRKSDGSVMTNAEVKTMRERLRVLTDDRTGGTSIEDNVKGGERLWPWLDAWCSHVPLSTVETRWKAGYAGTIQGNPIGVSKTSSPMRRWTVNDNYGHAVKAGPSTTVSTGTKVYIQDPMGFGTYRGQWVPIEDVRQFMRPMRRADGTYHTFLVKEGSLLSTSTLIEKGVPRPFSIAKGNRKIGYVMDSKSGRYTAKVDKVLAAPMTGTAYPVTISQYPSTQKPTGACVYVVTCSDPAYVGTVLAIGSVNLQPAPTGTVTPDQLAAIKAAAIAAGFNEALTTAETLIANVPRRK